MPCVVSYLLLASWSILRGAAAFTLDLSIETIYGRIDPSMNGHVAGSLILRRRLPLFDSEFKILSLINKCKPV
jgi:hypothetical protein